MTTKLSTDTTWDKLSRALSTAWDGDYDVFVETEMPTVLAQDVIALDHDLEDEKVETLVPLIERWRAEHGRYDGIQWDGQKVAGGAPTWLVRALQRNVGDKNSVIRVRDYVHLFDRRSVLHVVKPHDWIMRHQRTDSLIHVPESSQRIGWHFDKGAWHRRVQAEDEPVAEPQTRAQPGPIVLPSAAPEQTWQYSLTFARHPRLHGVFVAISCYEGRDAGTDTTFDVPARWTPRLTEAETVLDEMPVQLILELCVADPDRRIDMSTREGRTIEMIREFRRGWRK